MTPAERKAVGHIVRLACDLYAATMGNKPIYDNRHRLREYVGQYVDAQLPLLEGGYLAEWVIAANQIGPHEDVPP